VILWALILLNRAGDWSRDVRQALHSHILHFGGVSLRQFLPRQCPVFRYDRLSSRYHEVHDWCRLFIDLLSISDKPGETTFNGYLLDMNKLFERFVISVFKLAKESVPLISVKDHLSHHLDLDGCTGIVPDVTLEGPNRSMVAVDAKYKRTKGQEKAMHPDLYEVISYCTALGLIGQASTQVQGIIVYPAAESSAELNGLLRVITSKRPSARPRFPRLGPRCKADVYPDLAGDFSWNPLSQPNQLPSIVPPRTRVAAEIRSPDLSPTRKLWLAPLDLSPESNGHLAVKSDRGTSPVPGTPPDSITM